MPEAAQIFVSHCHEDNAWCRAFVDGLRQAGANVWYDEHNLGYGALQDEIERELRARPIFIVILSPTSISKPWVRRETNAAISLQDGDDTRIILLVVAEKCEVPLLWGGFRRTSGPGDTGLVASEAAGRVAHALALTPASVPIAPTPPTINETAEQAWERGKGLRAQKRFAEALDAYNRAIAQEPEQARYWTAKGSALRDLGRTKEALAAYDYALALNPKYFDAWNGKGLALRDLKRPEEALAAYEQACILKPKYPFPWNNKGNVLGDLKRYDEALAAFDVAIAADPTYMYAWNNKINLLVRLSRKQEADAVRQQRDSVRR